jgi:hypothetical protein
MHEHVGERLPELKLSGVDVVQTENLSQMNAVTLENHIRKIADKVNNNKVFSNRGEVSKHNSIYIFFAKVVKNYQRIDKNYAKRVEICKNGRKKRKFRIFFVKIFDISKKCCNFAKNFFGKADKELKRLII